MSTIERAQDFFNKEDYNSALTDIEKVIELDKTNSSAYFLKGACLNAIGNFDDAIVAYNEAIKLHPTFTEALNNLGVIFDNKSEYDKAIEKFSTVIELDPTNALAYSNRGVLWTKKKEIRRAIEDYDLAIKLDNSYTHLIHTVNELKLSIGEKIDLTPIIKDKTIELKVDFKTNKLLGVIDYIIRSGFFLLYYINYINSTSLIVANVALLIIEVFICMQIDSLIIKKIEKNLSPAYKDLIKKIETSSDPSSRMVLLYLITGLIISFWFVFETSAHSYWYQYVWIILKTLAGVMFFLIVVFFTTVTPFRYKPLSYKVYGTTKKDNKDQPENLTKYFPNVIPLENETDIIELDEQDFNDGEIAKIESDLKGIITKVDAYMLESVLLGALAFSGFLTIIASGILVGKNLTFLDSFTNFLISIKDIFSSTSTTFSTSLANISKGENLFLLIMLESLICSVFFILVLTLRLRFSEMSLKMDYLIRIMNIFNAKEEELINIKLESNNLSNPIIDKRASRISKKINATLDDAKKLIKNIRPVVTLMSLFRNLGIITFYFILVSSGFFFSGALSLFILSLAICTYLFRLIEASAKFEKIKSLLRRH